MNTNMNELNLNEMAMINGGSPLPWLQRSAVPSAERQPRQSCSPSMQRPNTPTNNPDTR